MHYYLCPRCNFRIAAKKRLCTTCGYKLPTSDTADEGAESKTSVKRSSFWAKFFGLTNKEPQTTEPTQEALG